MFREYEDYDGLGLAELVRSGDITENELLDAALDRLERRNPNINAFAHIFEPRARHDIGAGLADGPFRGVPFALKDLFMRYAGEPTGNGSHFWENYIPDQTSELFQRYRQAGFTIFGKTTTAELGLSASTETRARGATRNPWDLGRTSGGSSGGAAAAVAAGILPLAHASDSGGSCRIPASCCGLFGFKPSRGRMPMGPERGESSGGLGTAHCISRSVRDSAALLDVSAGPDLGAPYGIAPPPRRWIEEISTPPPRLRIALVRQAFDGSAVHPDCIKAVDHTASLCVDLGHIVEEAMPTIDHSAIGRCLPEMMAAMAGHMVDQRMSELRRAPNMDDLEAVTMALVEAAKSIPIARFMTISNIFHTAGRDLARFQQSYDVVLTPTLAQPPIRIGELNSSETDARRFSERFQSFAPFTLLANITGTPAMSVPLHWNEAGLPIGVQFIGRFGDEGGLLRLASQLENAMPWFNRRPHADGSDQT